MRYLILLILCLVTTSTIYAAEPIIEVGSGNTTPFVPMMGIPFLQKSGNDLSTQDYIQALYALAISAAALVMILRMMYAGIKIIFSEGVTKREEAKKEIWGMLFGFAIILGAVIFLETINPELTKLNALRSADSFNYTIRNGQPTNQQTEGPVIRDDEENIVGTEIDSFDTTDIEGIDNAVLSCQSKIGCRSFVNDPVRGIVDVDCSCTQR